MTEHENQSQQCAAPASLPRERGEDAAPESAQPQAAEGPPERDARGRFAPGNSGGPGNPYNRQTAAYRQMLREAVTMKDIHAIAKVLLANALKGDVAAARIVFQYVIGKPAEVGDPDRVDIDETRFWRDHATPPAVVNEAIERIPAPLASTILREMAPLTAQKQIQVLKSAVLDPDAYYRQQAERRREEEFDREWGASAWDAEVDDLFGPGSAGRRSANGGNGAAAGGQRPRSAAGQRQPGRKPRGNAKNS